MKHIQGVTLIELLVTISIAAIMMTVAVPGFQQFITSNRLSGMTMNFMGTLNYARSEAIKRGQTISVCKTYDATDSKYGKRCNTTACTSTSGLDCWDEGLIVFIDSDAGYLAGTKDIATDDKLRIQAGTDTGYSLRGSVAAITYNRSGATANTSTFAACQGASTPRDKTKAQAIIITMTSPRIGGDGDKDGIPEKLDGSEITSCESP